MRACHFPWPPLLIVCSSASKLASTTAHDVQRLEQALAAANDKIQALQTAAATAAAAVPSKPPPLRSTTPTKAADGTPSSPAALSSTPTTDVAVRVASVEASMTYLEAENKVGPGGVARAATTCVLAGGGGGLTTTTQPVLSG